MTRRFLPFVAYALIVLTGCQTPPTRDIAPPPSLQLVDSAPLEWVEGCAAPGSVIVDFTVDPQGRTTDIQRPLGPPCMQDALIAWVESFRYAPPGAPAPGRVEWLLVSANRR